jgi:LuxR family maltose regulon positive regulatory protein
MGEAKLMDRQILRAKLYVPRGRPDAVPRSRLYERLDEGVRRELTLVSAPAGFGKTTLLADWARGAERAVAWLSLNPDDNDPVRFWRYVVAALRRAGARVGPRALYGLGSRTLVSSRGLVTALINELDALPDEVALVLDDYHVIESGPIRDGVAFLADHLPSQLHLVISSRSDPTLPLARLRARGQLAELRAADLRFSSEESASFLRELWGLDLAEHVFQALESRTEGWAVGLQLAALSLQGRPNSGAFVNAFRGTHRYILDYLSEEVLEQQEERVRNFLLETSILGRLNGSLCDAVTGHRHSQAMLEELERANLFLIPLDDERRWYRFHNLFGDLLQAKLQQYRPETVAELHRRAGTWCEDNDLVDDAIRHALASGDTQWGGRLIEEHVNETFLCGESAILERRLSLLPANDIRKRPLLCFAQGLIELHVGHLDSVDRLISHAERAFQDDQERRNFEVPTDGGMVANVPAAIALLRSEVSSARGDPEGTTNFARAALAQMADEELGPRLWAQWLGLLADWMSGRMEEAESGFARMLTEARATPEPHPLTTSCHTLGWVQQARGELSAALRTYREGMNLATQGSRFLPWHVGEAHLGMAQVSYARNELEEALNHATKAIELTRGVVEFRLPAFGLVTLSWSRQAMGDSDGALEAMDEAWRLLQNTDVVTMFSPARAERASLLLAQGRIDEVVRWTEGRGLTENDEVSYPRERDYLVLARVLLARSEPARALALLDRLEALAKSQGRTGSVIEIRALQALALQAGGDHERALSVLADALALGRPEGYVRVFADEGAPMAALLKSLVGGRRRGQLPATSGAAQDHLNRVVRALGAAGGEATAVPEVAGLIEPLTARELEVLNLIATGKRNRDIAGELVVTLETVKKHVSHIFDKLAATNRTEAVTNARELGLLS